MSILKNKQFRILDLVKKYSVYFILAVLLIIAFSVSSDFRAIGNIMNLLNQMSVIGVLAIGQTIVLLTGNFDLSHGSYVALCSVLIALFMPHGIFVAIIVATLGLVFLGTFNAFFVNRGVLSLIVTLGMTGIARSLALFFANSDAVPISNPKFMSLSYGTVFGIVPYTVILWVAMVVISSLMLKHTRLGRHIYAVGGDKESARLSGIHINRIMYMVFITSALCAMIAGMFYASRLGVGLPDKSVGYELDSIASSVIGGTSLFGGIGTQGGTFVGVIVFGVITNFLTIIGVSAYWQLVFKGLIIAIAVYLNLRSVSTGKE